MLPRGEKCMKIVREDTLYLQKGDIMFLSRIANVPIVVEFFKEYNLSIFEINSKNKYEFVKFKNILLCNFFSQIDFIVDYDEIKDLTSSEMEKKIKRVTNLWNELSERFDNMDIIHQQKNISMIEDIEKAKYKENSLKEAFLFLQGKINMPLPEEILEERIKPKENKLD